MSAERAGENGRITVGAHEWSILRRGAAPEVERVIDRLVATAKAEALREAADALNIEGVSMQSMWGSNDRDKGVLDGVGWSIGWLRERSTSPGPTDGGA